MSDAEVDRIYTLIGKFTIALSKLDMSMRHLLGAVLRLDVNTAHALYRSQGTTAARREILSAASNALGEEDRKKVQAMLGEHASIFAERNRYMHDQWSFDPSAGSFRLQNERKLARGPTTADFEQFLENAMPVVRPDEIERQIARTNKLFLDMLNVSSALRARQKSEASLT